MKNAIIPAIIAAPETTPMAAPIITPLFDSFPSPRSTKMLDDVNSNDSKKK